MTFTSTTALQHIASLATLGPAALILILISESTAAPADVPPIAAKSARQAAVWGRTGILSIDHGRCPSCMSGTTCMVLPLDNADLVFCLMPCRRRTGQRGRLPLMVHGPGGDTRSSALY